MKYHIAISQPRSCRIELPASKSITNRALLISALAGCIEDVHHVAQCDDSAVMLSALRDNPHTIDTHNAGTAMRFLTAYCAITRGSHTLTGNDRMQQRPIAPLVEALRALGANIQYLHCEGYPPLHIEGSPLKGGSIAIDGSISSQYISALLLIAPYMEQGLQLSLTGEVVSRPYIDMTIATMQHYGAVVTHKHNLISVAPVPYKAATFTVESDWSAASYWYEIATVSRTSFTLAGLSLDSTQGDSRMAHYMSMLGIDTKEDKASRTVTLQPTSAPPSETPIHLNLRHEPDLAPALIMTCALQGRHFAISGLGNLRIKECDRIEAIVSEAAKLGYAFAQPCEGCIEWHGERCECDNNIVIDTHGDHRIAMAFAPAALLHAIAIDNPSVVDKSYPHFWHDLSHAGFTITTQEGKEIEI